MSNIGIVTQTFKSITGHSPDYRVVARGRINIIGEHTDYNQGFVLPGAIDRGLYFAAGRRNDNRLRVRALDIDRQAEVNLPDLQPSGQLWLNYLLGIIDQFRQRGHQLPGLDIVFGGDLPIGAGMSSSAALECGMALLCNELTGAGLSRPDLARLARQSSHQFVGVPCGIMDQFASLMGEKGSVLQLDCRSLDYRSIRSADGPVEWLLINSRVSHELADGAYERRVNECAAGVKILQQYQPGADSLRDISPSLVEAHRSELGDVLYRRCRYVTTENLRVEKMVSALQQGEWAVAGHLLQTTHRGLRDDYEVSCPEVDFLVDQAGAHPAVKGGRIMGGGFGGCTINLVEKGRADEVAETILQAYREQFNIGGESYAVHLAEGTHLLP